MFRMVHMVGVNLQWGYSEKCWTKWSLSQESTAKNNEANQRCQLKGPSTVDDAAIRGKKVAIEEIGKNRSPNNMMELNLSTKAFPSIQVWKIFGNPTRKKTSLKENSQQQKKCNGVDWIFHFLKEISVFVQRRWKATQLLSPPRSALRVLPALRFLRVRLCRDQGQRCQDLLDQRQLGWWVGGGGGRTLTSHDDGSTHQLPNGFFNQLIPIKWPEMNELPGKRPLTFLSFVGFLNVS